MLQTISNEQFQQIVLERRPILDVRAEIEFNEGHIPFSQCLPILNDQERAQVGTTYKKQGQAAAIELGQKLVSGAVKDQRVQSWKNFLLKNENSLLTCFRGGLRSRTAQEWLSEAGVQRPRLQNGYKAFRQYLIQQLTELSSSSPLIVIGGNTGSAKTHLLRDLSSLRAVLDLELHANHRGSAFGNLGPQPSQVIFENLLAYDLIHFRQNQASAILIEDESRMIGRCVQPEPLFENLRHSQIVLIEESLSERTENTFKDYILDSQAGPELFAKFKLSLKNISKRLGGLRYEEVLKDLLQSEKDWQEKQDLQSNKIWIEKLLQYYYDPMYLDSMERRSPKILFRGTRKACFDYLKKPQ